MWPEKHERHILLNGAHHKCGICEHILDEAEKIVVLAGNKSTTALDNVFLDPFNTATTGLRAASHRYSDDVLADDKWRLCRAPERACYDFHGSQARRYGCAVHVECLQVVLRHSPLSDAEHNRGGCMCVSGGNGLLDRLWQACVWARVPWTGARVPELELMAEGRSNWELLGTFVSCAARCGMAWLGQLPEPVLVSIMGMIAREGEFWRCVAALDMARRLAGQTERPLRTVPLGWLVSWERGETAVLATEEQVERGGLPPVVRLTVDADGVRKFERLATKPAFAKERYDDRVFVVEEERRLGVAVVYLKNDRLLLGMLNDVEEPGLDVWDTPTPPDLSRCPVRPVRTSSTMRYHTIDLRAITGLTFFQFGARIVGIHAHSGTRPCAMETWQNLALIRRRPRNRMFLQWLYVPLPREDTILTCGPLVDRANIHKPNTRFDLMFRTLLSGEITVSRFKPTWYNDEHNQEETTTYSFLLHDPEHPHTTLVYASSHGGRDTTLVVPYPDPRSQLPNQMMTAWTMAGPETYPLPKNESEEYWQYAEAPLQGVRQARVYHHGHAGDGTDGRPLAGSTKGLLLFYRNGGQRALGECRIGVDPFVAFDEPERVMFACVNEGGYPVGVTVRFEPCARAGGLGQTLAEEDRELLASSSGRWFRYEMKGKLGFWFDFAQARVEIIGGRAVEEEGEMQYAA